MIRMIMTSLNWLVLVMRTTIIATMESNAFFSGLPKSVASALVNSSDIQNDKFKFSNMIWLCSDMCFEV